MSGELKDIAYVTFDEVEIIGGITKYDYNNLNQLVEEVRPSETFSYTYDKNRNLVKKDGIEDFDYVYDEENYLTRVTVQKENRVTIESYTNDYEENRTFKTVNESDVIKYVVDNSQELAQVVYTTDGLGKEKATYTRGEELLCMEQEK